MLTSLGSMQGILTEAQNQKKKDEALLYGMGRDLVQDERAQQQALLAEKNYQENVAARIAQNALSAGTLENQMLATQNAKAHQDREYNLRANQIAEEKKTNDALAKGLMVSTETVLPDTTKQVQTGNTIMTIPEGTDVNKQFAGILPTNEESEKIRLGELLKGKTKEEQDAILKPMYLKSKEAEAAGVNKTKMEQLQPILDYKLPNPVVAAPFLATQAVKGISGGVKEWNRSEADKLLAPKQSEVATPKSYDQFKSTILGDVEKAKGKAKTLETKLLSENTKDEVKTQTVAGVSTPLPMDEYAKSLSVSKLAPQAQMTALKMHKDKIDKFEDRMAKVNEKALEHTYKKLDAQEKAMYDMMVAREKAVIEKEAELGIEPEATTENNSSKE